MSSRKNNRPFWKRVTIDIAGFGMLLAVPLVGWLPGPGGIPLLIGGLTLLSMNHEWAERLLIQAKTKGTSLYDFAFPNNKMVYLLYDLLGAVLVFGALYVNYLTSRSWLDTIALAVIFFGVGLLLANRKRVERIVNYFQKKPRA